MAVGRPTGVPAVGRAGAGLLVAALLVQGCASPGDDEPREARGSPPVEACETRRIEHRRGVAELEGVPERIVPVSFRDQDAVLALGVVPVAVQDGYYDTPYLDWPWVEPRLDGAEPQVLAAGEINFEEVAGLRPDLILGAASGLTAQEYRVLSRIAPTVAQLDEYVDFGVPWQASLRAAGRALCREEQAEELITALDAELAAVRARHPELGGASAVVAMSGGPGGAFWVFGPQDSRGRFLRSLGLVQPPQLRALAGDRFVATLSAERLDLVEADLLVWIASEEQRATLEASPMYQRLSAVRDGRVLYLDPEGLLTSAITNTTALNLPFLLDSLVPRIVEALGAAGAAGAEREVSR